jgi:hypothetical protein
MKRDPTTTALVPPLEQAMLDSTRAIASFQACRERVHPDIGCREQDLWSSLLAHLRACSPPLQHLQVAAVRQHCRSNHFAPLSAALNPLTLCMCSCFSPAQRFQLHFETAGRSRSTVLSARSSTTVVIIVGAARRHAPAAAGMKLFGTTVKWTRYERTMSPPLERIPCSPACHRAPSWLAGCPTLRRGKSVPHTRTTGLLERRAPLRPPMWQDASS